MTNADKFKEIFNCYATELWALPENEFLIWLNNEYNEQNEIHYEHPSLKLFKCNHCGWEYYAEVQSKWDEEYGFHYWEAKCPKCGIENEVNDCYWR